MNKRGQADISNKILVVLIMIVAIGFIMLLIWALMIGAPIFTSLGQSALGEVISFSDSSGNEDLKDATDASLGNLNTSLNVIQYVVYILFFGFIIAFCLMCVFVRVYPFLLFLWIIGTIIITGLSIYLSWSYQRILSNSGLVSAALQSWTTNHYILTYAPIIFAGLGIVGGIIMFALISRDQEVNDLGL